jgi:hypothetical protein
LQDRRAATEAFMKLMVSSTHPLPALGHVAPEGARQDDIRPGATLDVQSAAAESGGATKVLLSVLLGRVVPGTIVTSAGSLAFTADKVNAMPVHELAKILQSTPIYQFTDQSAQGVAEHVKSFCNSVLGRFVILGISGGMLTIGVCGFIWPKAILKWRIVQFVGGGLLLVLLVWLLYTYGSVEPKPVPQ